MQRLGTQAQFDLVRPLGDIETPICRASPAAGPWSRTINASSPRQYNDFAIAEQARFKRLTNTEKLQHALIAAFASTPGQMRDKAVEALSPANLAIMAGALAIWIGAHATPIGWVVDIGMLGLGVVALGAEAAQVISEIRHFALGVINAKSEADLHKAGSHLGKAIAIVGMDVVLAIVNLRQPKVQATEAGAESLLFGKYAPKTAQPNLKGESQAIKASTPPRSNSTITPEMEAKILYGERVPPGNRLIGAHSGKIDNAHPDYAVEVVKTYPDGTRDVKLVTQFGDGKVSKIKKSTLFPEAWTDTKTMQAVKEVAGTGAIAKRASDGATLHQSTVDGVRIEVIKVGDKVTSAYPCGQGCTDPSTFGGL